MTIELESPVTAAHAAGSLRSEMRDVLDDEAYLLDHNLVDEWLGMLAPDLEYRCNLLVTVGREMGSGHSERAFHFDETLSSLQLRIDRLKTGAAWAEDPPSRVRRFVSGVRAQAGTRDTEVEVSSNLLLTRLRLDWAVPHLLTCERRDIWRRTPAGWALRNRTILLDQTSLAVDNLSFFL